MIHLRIERRERLMPDLGRPAVVGILRVQTGVAMSGGGVMRLDPLLPIPDIEHLRWTQLVIGHSVPVEGLVTDVVSAPPVRR